MNGRAVTITGLFILINLILVLVSSKLTVLANSYWGLIHLESGTYNYPENSYTVVRIIPTVLITAGFAYYLYNSLKSSMPSMGSAIFVFIALIVSTQILISFADTLVGGKDYFAYIADEIQILSHEDASGSQVYLGYIQ